jgi:organic hydroperoxide reductase OsmC/OhrA
MQATEQPKVKHKTFTYSTNLTWMEGRSGTMGSDGKPSLRVSSPPEFKGESGVWTPEDLYVGSIEICHMTTFLAFAARLKMPVVSYQSKAHGILEFIDGDYRFTRVILFPTIVVEREASEEDVLACLRDSHKHCIISNSINTLVEVNPTIITQ